MENPESMESTPLVAATTPPEAPPLRARRGLVIGGGVALLFGVAVLGRASVSYVPKSNAVFDAEDEGAAGSDLSFTLSGEYGSAVPGDGMYPWKFIAEPHKVSTFAVTQKALDAAFSAGEAPGAAVKFMWRVVEGDVHGEGGELQHTFPRTGSHGLHVKRFADEVMTHFTKETAEVRYVKRELRTLSDVDREAFLGALQKVSAAMARKGAGGGDHKSGGDEEAENKGSVLGGFGVWPG